MRLDIPLKIIGTALILLFLSTKIDFSQTFSIASRISIQNVLLIWSITIFTYIMKAERLYILTNSEVRRRSLWAADLKGSVISTYTPAHVGELSKILLLSNIGVKKMDASASVFLNKLFDFLTVCALSITGVVLIPNQMRITATSLLLMLFAFAIFFFSIFSRKFQAKVFSLILVALEKAGKSDLSRSMGKSASDYASRLRKRTLVLSLAYTLMSWLLYGYEMKLILGGFGQSIGFFPVTCIMATLALSGLIPISISGLGIREGLAVVLLGFFGIPAESAVAASLSLFFINLAISLPLLFL